MYKNMFLCFLIMQKNAQLNRFVSVTLHCFSHSLRCSRAVSYIELLFCMADIVGMILLWSRHRGYTNSINNSNGTVSQKFTDIDRRC